VSRLTEKQLLFLTIGITVLLAGGLGFLIWSDLEEIKEEEAKTADLRRRITAAEVEIAKRPEREFQVIADREVAEREVAFLPEAEEIEDFWEVLETYARESGVRISEIAPSNGGSRGKRGPDGPIASVPQVMSLRGTVDEFLRFINLLENYERIINVVEYSLKSGDVPDADGKVRHAYRLALTTFTYSRRIADTIVVIPKYEEKRAEPEVKKWLSRIKIQEKETYTLNNAVGRRDPFVSIRKERAPTLEPTNAGDLNHQMALVDNLVQLVEALRQGLEFEEQLRQKGDLWRLQAQRKENRESYAVLAQAIKDLTPQITLPEPQGRFKKEVLEPWEKIQERFEHLADTDPPMTAEQVSQILKKVQLLFDERKWIKVQDEVRQFLQDSRKGEHVVAEAEPLVRELQDLLNRARVIQEFEKKKIEITAILYSEQRPQDSVAVINGKQMGEGDALDPAGTIIVLSIGPNFVIFLTEDVEIKRSQK
jgi:Tfp pilus assembly protein PilO